MSPNTTPSAARPASAKSPDRLRLGAGCFDRHLASPLDRRARAARMSLDRGPLKQIVDACGLRCQRDVRRRIAGRNLPTVNVNEFWPAASRRIDKIQPILFRARQAADGDSVPIQPGGQPNALSALSLHDRGGDLRPRLEHLRRSLRTRAFPRPLARPSAAKPRFPTAGSTSAIATAKSARSASSSPWTCA